MKPSIFLMPLIAIALCVTMAKAADISMEENLEMGCTFSISGQIVAGDFEKALNLLDELNERNHKHDNTNSILGKTWISSNRACLESPGGSYLEAVRIADLFLERQIPTALPRNANCSSACSIIFMAGTYAPTKAHNRILHPTAKLGFHAPALDIPNGNFTKKEVDIAYKIALQSVSEVLKLKNESSYIFADSLFQRMIDTAPSDMLYVSTVGEAVRWGIGVYPVRLPEELGPSEWANVCENMYALRDDIPSFEHQVYATTEDDSEGEPPPEYRGERDGVFSIHYAEGTNCYIEFSGGGRPDAWWETVSPPVYNRINLDGVGSASFSIGQSYERFGQETINLEAPNYMFFSPSLTLSELPASAPSWESKETTADIIKSRSTGLTRPTEQISFKSCWLTKDVATVTNVNEYVNLRRRPDLNAPSLSQVPQGEAVRLVEANSMWFIKAQPGPELCFEACQLVGANQQDTAAADQVRQCIDDNRLWYEITDARGNSGWVSRKFLKEAE